VSSNGENNAAPQEGATEQQINSLEGLPEEFSWVRKAITTANNEAARYRTERNAERETAAELKARLEGAVTVEDFQAAKAEWDSKVQGLVRERIIERHKLPEDLAELLKGEDEASLEEHAAKLAKYVPAESPTPAPAVEPEAAEPVTPTAPPLPPSGGRDPGTPADEVDPAELVKIARKRGFH
jgi:hypothetical protein